MTNRTYYYCRVSSRDQHLDRQLEAFRNLGAEENQIISDKQSGKDLERPGYQALRNVILRRGDTLVVKSLDRMSRSKTDIKNELQYFRDMGVHVKVIDLPTSMLDFPPEQAWIGDMVNNILIEVLGTIAEQERVNIRQRQQEGIIAARKRGVKFGRKKIPLPPNWEAVAGAWASGDLSTKDAIRQSGISRSSFYRLVHITKQKEIPNSR